MGRRNINRRELLKSVGAGGLLIGGSTIPFAGVVTAESDEQRFVVVGNPNAESRIENEGFEIMHSLADGEVLIVVAPENQQDDLEEINGVQHTVPDLTVECNDLELEGDLANEVADDANRDEFDEPILWEQQWDKRLMDIPEAHGTATGDGIRVAVIDSGIEPHVDLNLNTELSVRFKNGEAVNEGDPHDVMPGGHGTQVAGIIASSGFGTVGVAPDAELISINLVQLNLPVGFWTIVDLLVSLEYVREIEVDVVNMSLLSLVEPRNMRAHDELFEVDLFGLRAALERLTNMLTREDIAMSASAGNQAENLQTGGEWFFPGGMQGVLNVSATGPNDELVYYSNYGSRWIDVGAPGGGYETWRKSFCTEDGLVLGCEDEDDDPPAPVEDCACEPGELPPPFNLIRSTSPEEPLPGYTAVYEWFSGTSAAAPQVAGVAALVKEANPDLNARQIEQAIKRSAEFVQGQGDDNFGAGRVNAAKAVEEATK